MSAHKMLDAKASITMFFLCMIWGVQQVAIKGIADQISPSLQIALRSGCSALLVWLFMQWRREPLWRSRHSWKAGILVGILFTGEFLFVAEGLRLTTAAHMTVFLYTAPAFAAVGLPWFLPEEKLTPIQWIGIGLSFCGIATAFLAGNHDGSVLSDLNNSLLGDLFGLFAGISWAATTITVRCTSLGKAPASHTLFFQLLGAFVLLTPFSFVTHQSLFTPHWSGIISMVFQIIIVTFISYLIWFVLLKNYLASQLGVLSFMTPVFGVLASVLLLQERIQSGFISGTCLILAGIMVVNGHASMSQFLLKFKQLLKIFVH